MSTVGGLLELCFRDSGVFGTGEVPQAQDTTDALTRLNMMISQWNRRRWLIYQLVDTGVTCDGSQFYYVGVGGNFAIARPDRIEAAYIRQVVPTNPTPIDWPLKIITAYEDYSKIAIKTLTAAPSEYLFYDSGFPLGKLYPWPIPNHQYELHILTKAVLQGFNGVGDFILLPPEYEEAIYFNTMMRMRMAYRMKPDPVISGYAKASLNTIRRSNTQIAHLMMPGPITRGPSYSIYSDRGA